LLADLVQPGLTRSLFLRKSAEERSDLGRPARDTKCLCYFDVGPDTGEGALFFLFQVAQSRPPIMEARTVVESEDPYREASGSGCSLHNEPTPRCVPLQAKMVVRIHCARIDKPFSGNLFLGCRVLPFVVRIAHETSVIKILPSYAKVWITGLRLKVVHRHPFKATHPGIRGPAVRAAGKERGP
jgi:hypothetical protein